MKFKKIKRAVISISDKTNIDKLLKILKENNVEIISSGGSFKEIKKKGYKCIEVSDYTGMQEMLDGRVKTIHPMIHGGILNIRDNKKHQLQLKKMGIKNIDLVIVNFYPFENKLETRSKSKDLIENIDIGGPSLVRSAAKNFSDVVIISDPADYNDLINQMKKNKGSTSLNFRKKMSAKAFGQTAYYDSVISNWFNKETKNNFPFKKTIYATLEKKLRYGENPHQSGSIYKIGKNLNLIQLHGKELSYNNYNDIYAALTITKSFKKNSGATIIKHANPSGASIEKNQLKAFKLALNCDPISAFGGVVSINSVINKKLAIEINKCFFEVIIAQGFDKESLKILKKKKNTRLIDAKYFVLDELINYKFMNKFILAQNLDSINLDIKKLKFVTSQKPSKKQMESLEFAFNISKFVNSNAIVLVNNKSTIGIGSGQPSRVDSCELAIEKALKFNPNKIKNSVAASDAFFPFIDGVEKIISSGATAIIQPGGSIKDKEVIKVANKSKISMVLTGIRHFKH